MSIRGDRLLNCMFGCSASKRDGDVLDRDTMFEHLKALESWWQRVRWQARTCRCELQLDASRPKRDARDRVQGGGRSMRLVRGTTLALNSTAAWMETVDVHTIASEPALHQSQIMAGKLSYIPCLSSLHPPTTVRARDIRR